MKELSIEEKAKRYDEALEKAKEINNEHKAQPFDVMLKVFPELKESEDERIRKELIEYLVKDVGLYPGENRKEHKWLRWLEKQGESYTKKDVDDAYLKGVTDTKNEIEKQYEANYQIRKDIATFIFNYKGDIKDRAKWMDYLGIKVSFVEKQGEQMPAWSEEDETMITDLSVIVHTYFSEISGIPFKYNLSEDKIRTWLNSLKDRVQPKQEWSEENKKKYIGELQSLMLEWSNKKDNMGVCIDKHIDKLLSILCNHTQSQWKLSDEQMQVLVWCKPLFVEPKSKAILESLINDLKKLREE